VRGSLGLLQTDDFTARIFLTEAPSQSIRVDFFDSKLLFYGEGGMGAEYKWRKSDLWARSAWNGFRSARWRTV
jgi:hypothetical protein